MGAATEYYQQQRCPECGKILLPDSSCCDLCGQRLPLRTAPAAIPTDCEKAIDELPRDEFTFSLSTLFLFMTLCAIWAGMVALSPIAGIAFIVLCLPALLRTRIISSTWWYCQRQPMPALDLVGEFFASFAVVVAVVVLSLLALVLVFLLTSGLACLIGAASESGFWPGQDVLRPIAIAVFVSAFFLSFVAALYCAVVLLRDMWPRRW